MLRRSALLWGSGYFAPKSADTARCVVLRQYPRRLGVDELRSMIYELIPPDVIESWQDNQQHGIEGDGTTANLELVKRLHVPVQAKTGKLKGVCFVELASTEAAEALQDLQLPPDHELSTMKIEPYRTAEETNKRSLAEYERRKKEAEEVGLPPTTVKKPKLKDTAGTAPNADEAELALLPTLELDRYLLSPDIVYDVRRLHQKKRVTKGSKLSLTSLLPDVEPGGDDDVAASDGVRVWDDNIDKLGQGSKLNQDVVMDPYIRR